MENLNEKKIMFTRTKTGIPCMWESITKFPDLTRATTIVDKNGEFKNNIFSKPEAGKQALIPIDEGDFIIKSFKEENGESLSVLEILSISNKDNFLTAKLQFRTENKDETLNTVGSMPISLDQAIEETKGKLDNNELVLSKSFND